jgi:PhnB protein
MSVKPIPEGYHTVTPYLVVKGVSQLLDFLKQAFGAEEIHRSAMPDGTVMHAEIQIGNSRVMLGEAKGEHKPSQSMLYLYVEDTDAMYKRAMQAGGISIMEPTNQFYGDRNAGVKDHCDNQWWIATHVEDVSAEEMEKRMKTAKAC